MPSGTVKFFNAGKGFGFITADDTGKDVFVPSASVTASGLATLKPGQRVTFEEVPDAKGPKAVSLTLLAEAPRPVPVKERPPAPRPETRARLVFYHDASDWSENVLEDIRAAGHQPVLVNYLEAPPAKDELRRLSRLLQAAGQSLVRKFDPLFLELQLDDRFIGESEFWDAIVEHPGLINGPLLATEAKAGLLHTDESVAAFFAGSAAGEQPATKPKGLSARALQILAGGPSATTPVSVPEAESKPVKPAVPAEAPKPVLVRLKERSELVVKAEPELVAKAKPAAKPASKAKVVAKAKTKVAPKSAKPVKRR